MAGVIVVLELHIANIRVADLLPRSGADRQDTNIGSSQLSPSQPAVDSGHLTRPVSPACRIVCC